MAYWVCRDEGPIGDTVHIEALFRAHYAGLCEYAMTFVSSRAVAEDLVQDLFVRLWERREMGEAPTSERAYLYRAVRNRALNHLKAHRRTRREEKDLAQTMAANHRTSDRTLQRHQLAAAIEKAVAEMSGRQQQVFTLSRHHDLTYAEIASVLDISVKTVETHMMRALQALRQALHLYRE